MSRLEIVSRRLSAQKKALEWAANNIAGLDGVVIELGLGNGRTYDHLREILLNRDIYVFEREIAAHPDCIPERDFQFLGDFRDSLPNAIKKLGANVILAHLDIGTGEKEESVQLAQNIAPLVLKLLKPRAIIISDEEIKAWSSMLIEPLVNIQRGRIFVYQMDCN